MPLMDFRKVAMMMAAASGLGRDRALSQYVFKSDVQKRVREIRARGKSYPYSSHRQTGRREHSWPKET